VGLVRLEEVRVGRQSERKTNKFLCDEYTTRQIETLDSVILKLHDICTCNIILSQTLLSETTSSFELVVQTTAWPH